MARLMMVLAGAALLTAAAAAPANTECLLWYGDGCQAISDQGLCENARDGRPWNTLDGKKVNGEACAWCGGKPCQPGQDHVCDVVTFLAENISAANATGVASGITVATCEASDGTPKPMIQMPPTQLRNVTFSPMHTAGQPDEGQACRGSSISDASNPLTNDPHEWNANYYWIWSAASLAQCMDHCLRKESCTGIEYNANTTYCEVWWKAIQWTQAAEGYQCFRVNRTTVLEEAFHPDLSCLHWTATGASGGCAHITNENQCLSSRDGTMMPEWEGFKIHGQPCVWCGGKACTSKSFHTCLPYDYAVHGEGKVFATFLAKNNFSVAGCKANGHPTVLSSLMPAAHNVPDAAATVGTEPSSGVIVASTAAPEALVVGGMLGQSTPIPHTGSWLKEHKWHHELPHEKLLTTTEALTPFHDLNLPETAQDAIAQNDSSPSSGSLPWYYWLVLAGLLICAGCAAAFMSVTGHKLKKARKTTTRSAKVRPGDEAASREEMAPLVKEDGQGIVAGAPVVGLRSQLLMPHLFVPNMMPAQLSQYMTGQAQYMSGPAQAQVHYSPYMYQALAPGEMSPMPASIMASSAPTVAPNGMTPPGMTPATASPREAMPMPQQPSPRGPVPPQQQVVYAQPPAPGMPPAGSITAPMAPMVPMQPPPLPTPGTSVMQGQPEPAAPRANQVA